MTGAILGGPGGPDAVRRGPSGEEWLARADALGLRRQGNELIGPCPACGTGDDRFHAYFRGPRSGVFSCRICHSRGDSASASRILEAAGFPRANKGGRADFSPPAPRRPKAPPPARGDTTAGHAAAIWRAAIPATPDTPAARRLAARGVWGGPGDTPLPDSVRWIDRAALARIDAQAQSSPQEKPLVIPLGILGCIVYCAAPAVHIDALAPDGGPPAKRWRRTVGPLGDGAFVVDGGGTDGLHLTEGPTDALALAWHRGALALAVLSTAYERVADRLAREARGRTVTVWLDGDEKGRVQARALAARLHTAGIPVTIRICPPGTDPGDCDPIFLIGTDKRLAT